MQRHAIVPDTTGTTKARQQPRHIERSKKKKKVNPIQRQKYRKSKKKHFKKEKKYVDIRSKNKGIPQNITPTATKPQRAEQKYPAPEATRMRTEEREVIPQEKKKEKINNTAA